MKVFITATGTEIGKTHVACGLLRHWRAEGLATRAVKPVMSGYASAAQENDAARLLAAQGLPIDEAAVEAVSPWRFAAPLSPDWAAALEQRPIDYAAVLEACRARLVGPGPVLIEGIGGVMVPLTDTHTVLDLMADLALPVVLVAGTYLGTLSHSLTALAALRQRGLRCVAALSPTPECLLDAALTAATIARHGQVPVVTLARSSGREPDPAFGQLALLLDRVPV